VGVHFKVDLETGKKPYSLHEAFDFCKYRR